MQKHQNEKSSPLQGSDLSNIMNDPEMQAAIAELAAMDAGEWEEVMNELAAEFHDDPQALKHMEEAFATLSQSSAEDIASTISDLTTPSDVEVTSSVLYNLELLSKADSAAFETQILPMKDQILEAVFQKGGMTEEDVVMFRSDRDAWEKELRLIWTELSKEVDAIR